MLQVDNVREVKFGRYRVSLKGLRDSEQGQRCRNSIPEPRQQLMIKTSTPAHTKRVIWTEARCNTEENNGRRHESREEIIEHLLFFLENLYSFSASFFPVTKQKKDFHCINTAEILMPFFAGYLQIYIGDFMGNFSS